MNTLTEILSHPLFYKLGWTLLHLLWQAAAVALLLAIVLRLLRKYSASLRYIVACSALTVVVILPVVTIRLIPAPTSYALLEAESASLPPPMAEAMKIVPLNLEAVEPFAAIGLKQRVVNLLEPTLPYIVAGWVLGVFTLSLWHLGGWTHLQRLRRRLTKQADASLRDKLGALVEKLRITRPVRLLESALVQIPTVVGWVRPVILLPATALAGLTSEQIEALLAHELAHIRRGDYLINMLQTVVEILGFYHPAIWWISNKIRVERENCCDDIAVAICGDKMHYATALAEMERIRSAPGEPALAASGGNLLTRIRRLIGTNPAPKQRFNWVAALITAMVIAALAIPTTLALSRSGPSGPTDPAPAERTVAGETEDKAQILFELKYYTLSANSKLIKDAGKDGTFVRTDKAFA
ncbi:MAG: M56 family metallopeptidase, partial [Sedimentisphaerales bacterium]|nr:M56 family metallopeptidase [Sedimentisphaerales bacterium]